MAMRVLLFMPMLLAIFLPSNVFHSPVGSSIVLFIFPVAVGMLQLAMLNRMPNGVWKKITLAASSFYLGVGAIILVIAGMQL